MNVAVIGGGVAGLTAAFRLARAGHRPVVFERSRTGGLAAGFKLNGVWVEKYFHHLFSGDVSFIRLCGELGLADRLVWRETTAGFFLNGRQFAFSTPLDLLRFSPLSLMDRARLGLSVRRFQKSEDWKPLDGTSAREWHAKNVGGRVYDTVWAPLIRSKFGPYADRASAAWLWGRIHARGASRDGAKERLGYMTGGFQAFIEALERETVRNGGQVRTNKAVKRIIAERGRFAAVETADGREEFDRCLATCPMPRLLDLAPEFSEEYRRACEGVSYMRILCAALVLKRSLSPFYWLNVADPKIRAAGVIEHTNFIPPEAYGGRRVVYVFNYLAQDDPMNGLRPSDIMENVYLPDLRRMFPAFREGDVEAVHVFKDRYATPVYETGYAERIPPGRTPIQGLAVANTAQIYPEDRNMNASVAIAERRLKEMGLLQGGA